MAVPFRELKMDVAAVLLVLVFFTLSLALVDLCARLVAADDLHARGGAEQSAIGAV